MSQTKPDPKDGATSLAPAAPANPAKEPSGPTCREEIPDANWKSKARTEFKADFDSLIEVAAAAAKKLTDDGLPQGTAWQHVMDILKITHGR